MSTSTVLQPIDAFVQYLLSVKPYHSKLLEIIQKYNFSDNVNVNTVEDFFQSITFANPPLCKTAGFGVDFDDGCGFDADECCDLFQCLSGYGIIYDNSDLLVTAPIVAPFNDTTNNIIGVTGDYTYDQKINIKSIPDNQTIVFEGDVQTQFIINNLFLIVPSQVFPVVNTTINQFIVSGNQTSKILSRERFKVYGAGENSGKYYVSTVNYNLSTNLTTIEIVSVNNGTIWNNENVFEQWNGTEWLIIPTIISNTTPNKPSNNQYWFNPLSGILAQWTASEWQNVEYTLDPFKQLTPNLVLGYVEVEVATKDQGAYTVNTISSTNNIETIVTINEEFLFTDITETSYGAVQLRSGLLNNRIIDLKESCTVNPDNTVTLVEFDGVEWLVPQLINLPIGIPDDSCVNGFRRTDYKILYSSYDRIENVTSITLAGPLSGAENDGNVYLYGYMFGAGFDENEECSNPKPANVAVQIAEQLSIQIYNFYITPSPTPTITVTPSVTPTSSITPTITPSITVTASMTPSATVTPTPTPEPGVSLTPTITLTPSISLTPSLSNTVTPSLTPSLTVTPTVTRTPTLTATATRTITPSATPTITITPSLTPSSTPTTTPTVTVSITPSATASITPTAAATSTPANTPTPSVTPSITISSSVTPSPTITPSVTLTVTPTTTITPTVTNTITPSFTPSVTATNTRTVTPTPTRSPSVSAQPSPTPAPSVTPSPTIPYSTLTLIAGLVGGGDYPSIIGYSSGLYGSLSPTTLADGATVTGLTSETTGNVSLAVSGYGANPGQGHLNYISSGSFTYYGSNASSYSYSSGTAIWTWSGEMTWSDGGQYTVIVLLT